MNQEKLQQLAQRILDPKSLTTPRSVDYYVATFCKSISPYSPEFLVIEPELWCRQSCCDLNIDKYIKENGGTKVCGYKIWYHRNKYIEAERHAVLRLNNTFKDITFNSNGETRILFLPDIDAQQHELDAAPHRLRKSLSNETHELVQALNLQESLIPIVRMSNEESWETMISYEDWLSGKRMESMQVIQRS